MSEYVLTRSVIVLRGYYEQVFFNRVRASYLDSVGKETNRCRWTCTIGRGTQPPVTLLLIGRTEDCMHP